MSYYNTHNTKLELNGRNIFAKEASLSIDASIDAIYRDGQKSSNEFITVKGPAGTLDLQYYLTGKDFIKDFLDDQSGVISGNMAGMYFSSGYLSSYNFSIDQFSPMIVSATINFYSTIGGTFSPQPASIIEEEVLASVDSSIYGTGVGEVEKIEKINYSFSNEIIPILKYGDSQPAEVNYGRNEQITSIDGYEMTGIPLEGGEAGMLVVINDKNGSEVETFNITGRITNVDNKSSSESINKSTFSIRQHSFGLPPTISSFSPTSASAPGTAVTINGTNFKNVIDIFFFDTRVDSFTVVSETQITTKVPLNAIDGKIKVVTQAGEALSTSSFDVSNQLGVG